ncbi:MAG: hypothetical protein KJ922_03680, partial [Nanoarchaeota archaeon]|nr:hypothetical protein [Nanoarchaeota archaeon]
MKELIEWQKLLKKKKPKFLRQDSHKKVKLGQKWRRPKGIDSKIRMRLKGYRRARSTGWGSPTAVKGLTKDGLMPVLVRCAKDIEDISEGQIAVISTRLGEKKKIDIIKALKEKSIKILNIKDADAYVKSVQDGLVSRKSKRKDREKAKLEKKAPKKQPKKEDTKKE